MNKKNRIGFGIFALTAALFGQGTATAQENIVDNEAELEEVVVIGLKASIIRALEQKREAIGTIDAISAEDLGKFPDLNLSESIQRIPGVTLNRGFTGEGQQINLRGLGPSFSRVEVNGMTGPSSGGNRAFGFDIFPSELFSNVVVEKTGRARQSEGGLAGVVSLETPKPLDHQGFKFSASTQGNQSENADDLGSRFSIFASNNFNDIFGIAAAVVQSDTTSRVNQIGGFSSRPFSAAVKRVGGVPVAGTPEELAAQLTNIPHYIVGNEEREVTSGSLTLQWRLLDNLEISFDGLFSNVDKKEFTTRFDAPSESNITAISDAVIENGLITSATLSGIQQRIGSNNSSHDEDIKQFVLRADWKPTDSFKVSPYLGIITRKIDRQSDLLSFRRADLSTGQFIDADVSYTHRGDFVDWTTTGTNFSSTANANEFLLNVFIIRPSSNQDEDLTAKLDFQFTPIGEALISVDYGLRYSDRTIEQAGSLAFISADSGVDRRTLPSAADALLIFDRFKIDGAPSSVPRSLASVDPVRGLALYLPNGLNGPSIAGTSILPSVNSSFTSTFDLQEKTLNAYAEATYLFDKFLVNAGVRYLKTDQSSNGFSIVNDEPAPVSAETDYSDFLPSVSVRYELREDMYLRASYSKSLTRPSLGNLAPSETVFGVDETGGTGFQGNPDIEPFSADNFDVSFEWYFAEESLLSANIFVKQLDGIIDTVSFTENRTFPRQKDSVLVTAPIVFIRPDNGASADIKGVEFAFQSPLTFMPEGVLQNLGVFFNYTNVESSADFQQAGDVRSTGLPGLSENSFNTALYYDDGRFDARLAYAWRDEYLHAFSGTFGVPRFQKDYGQLDLSANYRITDNLTLQFQALNLNKEQVIWTSSVRHAPNIVRQVESRYIFGARYSF